MKTQEESISSPCDFFSYHQIFVCLGQVAKGSNHVSIQLDGLSHVDFACATLLRDLTCYGLLNGFCDDWDLQQNGFP